MADGNALRIKKFRDGDRGGRANRHNDRDKGVRLDITIHQPHRIELVKSDSAEPCLTCLEARATGVVSTSWHSPK